MKARIKWIENVSFVGESESGHALVMDGAPGRRRPQPRAAPDGNGVDRHRRLHRLRRRAHPAQIARAVTDCVVEIDAERAAEDPKVFTRIHFHFVVTGKGLKPQQVERAVHLSAEKYCSASIMLGKTAAITHDFEIREA